MKHSSKRLTIKSTLHLAKQGEKISPFWLKKYKLFLYKITFE